MVFGFLFTTRVGSSCKKESYKDQKAMTFGFLFTARVGLSPSKRKATNTGKQWYLNLFSQRKWDRHHAKGKLQIPVNNGI